MNVSDDYEKSFFEGGEPQNKEQSKIWVLYAVGAMINFTLCNSTMSIVVDKAGGESLQYFSSGFIICAIAYNIFESINTGKLWNNQNIIVDS